MNTAYAYETDSDLASLGHAWAPGAGQTPATFGFQHDAGGRITLTQVNRPDLEWMPTLAEAASYGVPTNLNQTTSVNGTALTWDHNGNLDQHGTTDYQWTYGNRLWRVVKPTSTTEYAYDSTDRRTVVIEDGVMTRTLWSGADEVGEYDAAGALRRRFIPDGTGAMDARLAMVAADGTVSWFHTNHQGSVIAMSNGAGAAIAVANYSEYGKLGTDASGNPLTAPPGGSPFGYTGRQWDAKAGLYNYRARYYDPALGVFLSMDPIGTKDDPNLYMYVANDPVNLTDPTGKQARLEGQAGDRVLRSRVQLGFDVASSPSKADDAAVIGVVAAMGAVTAAVVVPEALPASIAALRTPSTGRVFWSGGRQARDAAAELARRTGGTTLEQTAAGRGLEALTNGLARVVGRDLANRWTAPLWRMASRNFAEGAEGPVTVVIRGTPREGSVWRQVEEPILQNNNPIRVHRVE